MPTDPNPTPANAKLLTIRQVAGVLGLSSRTAWKLVATGALPKPLALSGTTRRWLATEIDEYITRLASAR